MTGPAIGPRVATIPRQRLVDRVQRRFEVRLTLVVGGGGCGKTTLLAEAIAAETANVDVWHSCTVPDSNDDRLAEELARATAQRLGDGELGSAEPLDSIAELVLATAPTQVCFVLDDTHHLGGSQLLTDLINRLPANGHLVLSGRRRPDLDLARLEAGGLLEVVDQNELLLTEAELVLFANLRGVDVATLADAHGWPAFVELATRSHGSDPRAYLEQEALDSLSTDRRRHLAALVLVGGGDDDVAMAVTGRRLADLVEQLPLVRWSGGWAQLHDLWGELLAQELTPAERTAAAVAAARVARRRGDIERAISLCTEGEAWDELLVTLEHAVAEGVVGGLRPRMLARWRATVPTTFGDTPVTRLLDGLIERERDPTTDEATDALDQAADGFRLADNPELELVALSHLGYVARISGEPKRVGAARDRVKALGDHHPPAEAFLPLCDAWLALVTGRPDEQLRALEAIDPTQLPELWRATRDHLLAHALTNLGRPHEALAAVPRDIESGHLAIPGALSTELGCHWWAGHPEVILEWPVDGIGPDYGARDRFVTNVFLALCRAYAGDVSSARRLVALAEDGAGEAPATLISAQLYGVRLAIDIVEGREIEAGQQLSKLLEQIPLGGGISEQMLRSFLTIPYVLLPSTRGYWDSAELGPSLVENRHLSAAFAAARDDGDLGPVAGMRWPEPGFIAARFPVNWAIELALYGARTERYEAFHLAAWLCEHWGRPARAILSSWSNHPVIGPAARDLLARTPAPPDQPTTVRLLGETRLTINQIDTADPDWRRERVRALMVLLVLNPDTSRNHVAAALWPDLDPDRAAKNLRTTLNYVHRVLEPQRSTGEAAWFVRSEGQQITLHASLDVDLWRFRDLLDQAEKAERRGHPTVALPLLVEACGLWRGDLAADLDHEWLELDRIHLRGKFVRAACRAAELLAATGRAAEAVEVVRPAVEVDPWNERSYEALAAGYREMGDITSARAIETKAAERMADLDS